MGFKQNIPGFYRFEIHYLKNTVSQVGKYVLHRRKDSQP